MSKEKEHAQEIVSGVGYGDRVTAIYLSPGVDLLTGILKACKTSGITSGFVVYCIGSLTAVSCESASYDTSKPGGGDHVKRLTLEGPIQVLSGQGCIGSNKAGDLFAHLHITFIAGRTGTVLGGHIEEGGNPVFTRLEAGIIGLKDMEIATELNAFDGKMHMVPRSL